MGHFSVMNSYSGGRRKDSIRGISFPIWKYNFVDTLSQLTTDGSLRIVYDS